jgi:hypothetical protein
LSMSLTTIPTCDSLPSATFDGFLSSTPSS